MAFGADAMDLKYITAGACAQIAASLGPCPFPPNRAR